MFRLTRHSVNQICKKISYLSSDRDLCFKNLRFDDCTILNKLLLSTLHLKYITFDECTFDFKEELKKPPKTVMHHDTIYFSYPDF